MRRVDAALIAGDARKVDDLPAFRVGAWNVLQPGREADGAISHGAEDELLHPVELALRRIAVRSAHDFAAHGVVADERREIYRHAGALDSCQRLPDIECGRTAVARDDGRDAHAYEVLCARFISEIVGVGVHIDEAGRHDQTGRVDDVAGFASRDRADGGDPAVLDRHVRAPGGRAGAIDDLASGNHQIESWRRLAARSLSSKDKEHRQNH